ncbi:hypothetical protein EDF34_0761 [Cellulomonas sp. PhB150]|nr:hypothetical protein EDF34_0761 [Cellulomonas sp. PhB150]
MARGSNSRVVSVLAAVALSVTDAFAAAVPADAAMNSKCGLYPGTPYRSGGHTYYSSITTCGNSAYAAYAKAQLRRVSTVVASAPAASSGGTTTLTSSSSTTSCTAGNYRTYGWGNDTFTGAEEGYGAYASISC